MHAACMDKNVQLHLYTTYFIIIIFISTILNIHLSAATAEEDDIRCLRGLHSALADPNDSLDWNFNYNASTGFVCSFNGITCWNFQENRVLGINLPSLSLSGRIPASLQFCSELNHLDLSGNQFSGPIPTQLCDWLPNVVTLDLSNNSFSGPVPPDLSECQYLNTLNLTGNKLSGAIPSSLAQLDRLTKIDLSNNDLMGQVPPALGEKFNSSSFDGNSGLCGRPVSSDCGVRSKRSNIIVIAAATTAAIIYVPIGLLITYVLWRWFLMFKRTVAKYPAPLPLISSSRTNLIVIFGFGVVGGVIGGVIASSKLK